MKDRRDLEPGRRGRGFAALAWEVRGLAQRSAAAAKEIKALISTASSQRSTSAWDSSGRPATLSPSCSRAMGHAWDAHGRRVQHPRAGGRRDEGTGWIADVRDTAVTDLDPATQQNVAMVEQSTAANRTIAEEADRLASRIGQFKIAETTPAGLQQRRRQAA